MFIIILFLINNITNLEKNNIKRLWVKDFKNKLEKNDNIVIDLRTIEELRETWIILWAIHVNIYDVDFINKIKTFNKNNKYIIYCRSWYRSYNALCIMNELWFMNISDLKWWINLWINSWEKVYLL